MAPFRALAKPYADLIGPMPYPAQYQFTAEGEHASVGVLRSSFLPDLAERRDRRDRRAPLEPRPRGDGVHPAPRARRRDGPRPRRRNRLRPPRCDRDGVGHHGHVTEEHYGEALAWTEAYQAELSEGSTGVYSNFLADEGAARVAPGLPRRDATSGSSRSSAASTRTTSSTATTTSGPRPGSRPVSTPAPATLAPPVASPPGAHPRLSTDRPTRTGDPRTTNLCQGNFISPPPGLKAEASCWWDANHGQLRRPKARKTP